MKYIVAAMVAVLVSIPGAQARVVGHREPLLAYLIGQDITDNCGRAEDQLEALFVLAEVNDIQHYNTIDNVTLGDRFYNLAAFDDCGATRDWANIGGNALALGADISQYGGYTFDGVGDSTILGAGNWLAMSRQDNEQICQAEIGLIAGTSNGIVGLWNAAGGHYQNGSMAIQLATAGSGNQVILSLNSASPSAKGDFGTAVEGLDCAERATAAGLNYWANGTLVASDTNADTSPSNQSVVLGGCCSSSSPTFGNDTSAGVYFRPAENSAQHLAFNTIVDNDLARKGTSGGGGGTISNCTSADTAPCTGPTGSNWFQYSDISSISPGITRLCNRNTPPRPSDESAGRGSSFTDFPLNCTIAENQSKFQSGYGPDTNIVGYDEIWADGCTNITSGGQTTTTCAKGAGGYAKENQLESEETQVTCPASLPCSGQSVTVRLGFSSYTHSNGCVLGKSAWMLGAANHYAGGVNAGWGYTDLMHAWDGNYDSNTADENTVAGNIWSNQSEFLTAVANTGLAGGFTACASYGQSNCVSWNPKYGWLAVWDVCAFPPVPAYSAPGTLANINPFIGVRWDSEWGDYRYDCTSNQDSACKFMEKGLDIALHYGSSLSFLFDDLFGSNATNGGLDNVSLPAVLSYMESGVTGTAEDRMFMTMAAPATHEPTLQAEWCAQLGIVYGLGNTADCTGLPAPTDPGLQHLAIIFGLSGESRASALTINAVTTYWHIHVLDLWPNNGNRGGSVFYAAPAGISCTGPGGSGTGWNPLLNARIELATGMPETCPNEQF